MSAAAPFEELNSPLVFLRPFTRRERSQVSPLPGPRILFSRIETVFPAPKLSNHDATSIPSLAALSALRFNNAHQSLSWDDRRRLEPGCFEERPEFRLLGDIGLATYASGLIKRSSVEL